MRPVSSIHTNTHRYKLDIKTQGKNHSDLKMKHPASLQLSPGHPENNQSIQSTISGSDSNSHCKDKSQKYLLKATTNN